MAQPHAFLTRVTNSLASRSASMRGHPALSPRAVLELWRERAGHPADVAHRPHLLAAVEWLARAQDASPDDGIARGYLVTYDPHFRHRGWQPSYPETTGYIIPTLLEAAAYLDRPELADRAIRAARWEVVIQLESGAVQGGFIGQGRQPAVFNTGQVMLGWLASWERTGDPQFEASIRRAGTFLVSAMAEDGHWRNGNSPYASKDSTLYNARVAWALIEAGARLRIPSFTDAGARNLRAVVARQHANGWFPDCCLTDAARPLLHTLAYTIRGLLEGARLLEDDRILRAAELPAAELAERVRVDGWMAGRFNPDWSPASDWSCLTGQAQMANVWMRLFRMTGNASWMAPVPRVLHFLKRTQNRASSDPGIRGGIKGAFPMNADYGRYQILSWATKYFADALMRHEQTTESVPEAGPPAFVLA